MECKWRSGSLNSQEVDNNGSFEFTVWMPAAPKGNYTIIAKGSTSGFAARTGIRIRPVITLSAVNGGSVGQSNPGGQISVTGGGFNANEQVNVYFQTKKNGVTTIFTTDSTGSIDTTITVPMHYSSGTTYYVYAKNVTGTAYVRAKYTFLQVYYSLIDLVLIHLPEHFTSAVLERTKRYRLLIAINNKAGDYADSDCGC